MRAVPKPVRRTADDTTPRRDQPANDNTVCPYALHCRKEAIRLRWSGDFSCRKCKVKPVEVTLPDAPFEIWGYSSKAEKRVTRWGRTGQRRNDPKAERLRVIGTWGASGGRRLGVSVEDLNAEPSCEWSVEDSADGELVELDGEGSDYALSDTGTAPPPITFRRGLWSWSWPRAKESRSAAPLPAPYSRHAAWAELAIARYAARRSWRTVRAKYGMVPVRLRRPDARQAWDSELAKWKADRRPLPMLPLEHRLPRPSKRNISGNNALWLHVSAEQLHRRLSGPNTAPGTVPPAANVGPFNRELVRANMQATRAIAEAVDRAERRQQALIESFKG